MIFGYPYLEKQIMAGRQTQIGRSMISLWSNTLIEDFQANHGWLLKSIMYETDNVHPEMMILKLSWRIYNQWVDILGIYNYIYIHIIYIHIIYIYIIYICMCTPSVIPSIWIWMHHQRKRYVPPENHLAHILHHKVLESIGLMMGLHPHCSHIVVGGVFSLLSSPFSYLY